ncbi:MAG: hypothetical protein Q9M75_09310 [Ghiorsea sp.]|nr:hypothetical protein [Ghiorsea sp.]
MKHSMTIGVEFCFKGETFSPTVVIDLAEYLQEGKDLNHIYMMLAKEMGLDEYRHEYDVMVMQDLLCQSAEGIAAEHVENGQIDWQGLEEAWQNEADLLLLQPIANKFFNVESLDNHPKLASALLEAYRAGQDKAKHLSKTNMNGNEVF